MHLKYHCRPGAYDVDWHYSLGYKVHHQISEPPNAYWNPSTEDAPPSWHTRGGWKSICWGYYADDDEAEDNYGNYDCYDHYPDWRQIEEGEVGLRQEGILDIHEALFGPITMPRQDDADAVLAYRKQLVATIRLLFAAVGIDYWVACTDGDTDARSAEFLLEGLSDKWVARGIRAACRFQLSGDAEAAKRGLEERTEEATRRLDDEDEGTNF